MGEGEGTGVCVGAQVSGTWLPASLTSLRPAPRPALANQTLRRDQEGLEIFILVSLPK